MKTFSKIFLVLFIVAAATALYADENEETKKPERQVTTLFGTCGGDIFISGYGALTGSYSRIKDKDAWFGGVRGGVIVNNLVFGGSFSGLVYPDKREEFGDNSFTDGRDYIDFGYGGFMTEYYFSPTSLVHFSVGTTIGGGALTFHADDNDDNDSQGEDVFFAVEPEINVFVNITRFCRIGLGGSYRYINGIDNDNYKDKDFSGFNAKVIAAFGWF